MNSKLAEMLSVLKGLCRAKKTEDGWIVDADAWTKAIELIYKYGDEEQKNLTATKLEEMYDNTRKGKDD